jgi:cytochrome P450
VTELSTDDKEAATLFGQLFSAEGAADSFPIYAKLHEHGEAASLGNGMVAAFGYEVVDVVLRDPASLVFDEASKDEVSPGWREHPALAAGSMLDLNEPEHGPVRSLVAGAFTPRRVAAPWRSHS